MNSPTTDILTFLNEDRAKDLLRFLTAGSVDDGKSTLIGRLLVDSKRLYDDQLATLISDSKRMGRADGDIDYSLLLDGLKAEREQGITIDVAYRYFSTKKRKFIIADTPGHEQYTRNTITGASTANVAVILIDAQNGITAQTRRHTRLVHLLGIRHVLLAVNKMDLVGYSESRFEELVSEYRSFVSELHIPDVVCVPLSARFGDNVVERSPRMPWYVGTTLLHYLETVPIENDCNLVNFRFPIQYVVHPHAGFRGLCGKISSGVIRKGMEVIALPSMKTTHVKSIITYDGNLDRAFAPQSIMLTLDDEIDISRGEMLVSPDDMPLMGRNIQATMVWMDETPMDTSKPFFLKHTTSLSRAYLAPTTAPMHLNEIAPVNLTTAKELFFDPYTVNRATGAFILIDPISHNTSAVGMITAAADDSCGAPAADTFSLNLSRLGITGRDRDIARKVVDDLSRQGLSIKIE